MVDLEPIREISHASAAFVGVSDYYYFVAAIDQFLREFQQTIMNVKSTASRTVDS